MSPRSQLRIVSALGVTALGRRLDSALCAGSIANAARSVHQDEQRARQRLDSRVAVRQLEQAAQDERAPDLAHIRRIG
jgi:hypothetical protein